MLPELRIRTVGQAQDFSEDLKCLNIPIKHIALKYVRNILNTQS